jgi:hypothetical protein
LGDSISLQSDWQSSRKKHTRRHWFTTVILALFTIAKLWNHPRFPKAGEWINKMHSRVLIIKKNEIISFTGKWMKLKIIMLSEISQAQKAKYPIFTHVESRPKVMMIIIVIVIIMEYEHKMGEEERIKVCYTHI